MSRRRSVAAMGLAGVVAALVVAVGVARSVPQEPSVAYGVAQGEAAKISASVCASCHGDNLAGGRSSSLIDDAWVYGGSDEDLAASIRDGRPGTLMPPFKATLDERQIRSLVVLIREYAEKGMSDMSEKFKAEGSEIYQPAEKVKQAAAGDD